MKPLKVREKWEKAYERSSNKEQNEEETRSKEEKKELECSPPPPPQKKKKKKKKQRKKFKWVQLFDFKEESRRGLSEEQTTLDSSCMILKTRAGEAH